MLYTFTRFFWGIGFVWWYTYRCYLISFGLLVKFICYPLTAQQCNIWTETWSQANDMTFASMLFYVYTIGNGSIYSIAWSKWRHLDLKFALRGYRVQMLLLICTESRKKGHYSEMMHMMRNLASNSAEIGRWAIQLPFPTWIELTFKRVYLHQNWYKLIPTLKIHYTLFSSYL